MKMIRCVVKIIGRTLSSVLHVVKRRLSTMLGGAQFCLKTLLYRYSFMIRALIPPVHVIPITPVVGWGAFRSQKLPRY